MDATLELRISPIYALTSLWHNFKLQSCKARKKHFSLCWDFISSYSDSEFDVLSHDSPPQLSTICLSETTLCNSLLVLVFSSFAKIQVYSKLAIVEVIDKLGIKNLSPRATQPGLCHKNELERRWREKIICQRTPLSQSLCPIFF